MGPQKGKNGPRSSGFLFVCSTFSEISKYVSCLQIPYSVCTSLLYFSETPTYARLLKNGFLRARLTPLHGALERTEWNTILPDELVLSGHRKRVDSMPAEKTFFYLYIFHRKRKNMCWTVGFFLTRTERPDRTGANKSRLMEEVDTTLWMDTLTLIIAVVVTPWAVDNRPVVYQ